MSLRIREVSAEDAEILFRWRNDPVTRAMFVNTEPVQWAGHVDWLGRVLKNPHQVLLIGERDGIPIGTVRFDQDGSWSAASWTVAPEARGKGTGAEILSASLVFSKTAVVVAHIKKSNIASKKIAEKAGFRFAGSDDDYERWEFRRDRG